MEKVEIVRAWWTAIVDWFNSPRDPDALAQLVNERTAVDVIYEEDPRWPDARAFRGRAAVYRRFLEYVDLMQIEGASLGEVIDAGDSVLAEIRIEMLGGDPGEAVEHLWSFTAQVEGGAIAYMRSWYDPDEAARAAGLRG
jgi:ketosteroid isomerase-like protein